MGCNYKFKIIKKSSDSFVLVNTSLGTHAHLPSFRACRILIYLIRKNEYIKNDYLRQSKERLVPTKRKKDRYIDKHVQYKNGRRR